MEYTITLTEQEMIILNNLLVEAPYKIAAPMIDKINTQISKAQSQTQDHSIMIDNS